MANPAVFIDRDGVINVDHGYVHTVDDFEYIEGVFEACKKLKDMGYLLILVTNQAGIARGIYTEAEFTRLTEWMDWNFVDHDVEFDGIYYCPHHPTEGKGEYLQDCDCRKPEPGMLLSACEEFDIDMDNSIMIGDKTDDMTAATTANVGTKILVRTGKPVTEQGEALASVVLDSVADVPAWLAAR